MSMRLTFTSCCGAGQEIVYGLVLGPSSQGVIRKLRIHEQQGAAEVIAETTSFIYDSLFRLSKATLPADSSGNQPVTTFKYPDTNTVEGVKSVTPTTNDDVFSYCDGFGRANKTVHVQLEVLRSSQRTIRSAG